MEYKEKKYQLEMYYYSCGSTNDKKLETEELEMYYYSCGNTHDKKLETEELEMYYYSCGSTHDKKLETEYSCDSTTVHYDCTVGKPETELLENMIQNTGRTRYSTNVCKLRKNEKRKTKNEIRDMKV